VANVLNHTGKNEAIDRHRNSVASVTEPAGQSRDRQIAIHELALDRLPESFSLPFSAHLLSLVQLATANKFAKQLGIVNRKSEQFAKYFATPQKTES
jgi:hypothetical protein